MTDTSMPSPAPAAGAPRPAVASSLRSTVIACYILYLLGAFSFGLVAFIGLVIAYLKRADAAGTPWASHFDNMIALFWVTIIVSLVAIATLFFYIGFVIAVVLYAWYLYRVIRGLVRAFDNRSY